MIFVALGNPGEEYELTRHNAGRIALEFFRKKHDFEQFVLNKKLNALFSEGKIKKDKITLLMPETFMNKSGNSVRPLITSKKKALDLVVIHDDLDLPIGKIKISFNKSAGGHRGVESIVKNIKTEEFTRVRIGISPATPSGKLKKPIGEEAVEKCILGKFSKPELETLKKVSKNVAEALELISLYGWAKAASLMGGK